MADEIDQRIAGRAVIMRDGKVLIMRESNKYNEGTNVGKYDLPGGRIKPGESIFEGLARETKEECGLDIKVGKPFYVGEWSPVVHGKQLQIIAIYFKCEALPGEVKLGEDHDDYRWINPVESGQFNLMPPNAEVLKNIQ